MRYYDPRVRLPEFVTNLFGDALWRMPTHEPTVYLTFDDGPIPEVTPWVLELLRNEGARATFFCVGENVAKYPDTYRQVLADGHSVGNHTYNHWQGIQHDNEVYIQNVEKAAELIRSNLFRPPHGWMKPSQYKFLKKKYEIVMWDLITCDYNRGLSHEDVFLNVRNYVRPGSIVTFHDSLKAWPNLSEALPRAIAWMKNQGFRFEAIPYIQAD